ncbi:MAG: MopE-related protein [Myxococcota bacterium]|nr:MopE-related protein [Myxococcota bacterium]
MRTSILLISLAALLTACNKDPDLDEDGFPASEDCNDEDASIHPDAEEVCDGIDNNCDAITDVDATDVVTWYGDSDGDGFGGEAITLDACEAPAGFLPDNSDCDDNDATVSPDGLEICDGVDNDCDGLTDSDDDSVDLSTATDWYPDADGDGYGVDADAVQSCSAPDSTYVLEGGDCDDTNADLSPSTVWYGDADGDGYGAAEFTTTQCEQPDGHVAEALDCDDRDATINPDASEVCDGGIDNDCDGVADDADDSLDLTTRSLWYPDNDADSYGDSEDAGVEYCAGPAGTTLDNSDCDDAESAVSPDATEVCNDGIDNDCSGDAPECGLSGDNAVSAADFSFTGTSTYDYVGRSTAVGDVNGDSIADILVGAYGNDTAGSSAGAAFAVYGSVTGAISTSSSDWAAYGDSSSDYFGYDVDLGDFNGDGYDDAIVGADGVDENGSSSGAAYIFYGSASGLSTSADAMVIGENSSDYLGGEVAALGDVDGDGLADFAVGADGEDSGGSSAGTAYIWFGVPSAVQTADEADVAIRGEASYDYMGGLNSITGADYNGDGTSDVMAAAYSTSSGDAYITYGPLTSGMDFGGEDSDITITGESSSDNLGYGSASGDLNNDGYDDLALGAYGHDTGGSSAGRAYVFYGSATSWSGSASASVADVIVDGANSSDYLGRGLAIADLNSDGNNDLMVAAGGNDDNGSTAGKVYVFNGPLTSGYSGSPSTSDTQIGGAAGDYCGYYDVAAGDFSGDGATDYIIPCYYANGDYGSVYVFFGSGM